MNEIKMSPFENEGQTFRFENDLDWVFYQFLQSMNIFDFALENREKIQIFRKSIEFQNAVRGLDYEPDFNLFRPTTGQIEMYSAKETVRLHEKLKKVRMGLSQKKKLWEKFVEHVFIEWRSNADLICTLTHRQSVWDLLEITHAANSKTDRQLAAIRLVDLDALFYYAPGVSKTIKEAAFFDDKRFLHDLSRALDPIHKTRTFENRRQEYALRALSCYGYETKSVTKWAEFFSYFNQQIEKESDRPLDKSKFIYFEKIDNLRQAIKRYDIPKSRLEPGRPRH